MPSATRLSSSSSAIGAAYVRLALAIEQHQPGAIDAYFGPPEWKRAAETADPQPLPDLTAQAHELADALEHADARSRKFLAAQVTAMQTTLRLLAGEQLAYADEVRGLYAIEPRRVDDRVLEAAMRDLESMLPGPGTLRERMQARRRRFEVSAQQASALYALVRDETRRRTRALFDLPDGEQVEITQVNDKAWGAYNWYRGKYQSLIEVNTDSPAHVDGLVELMAHEGYPGHHTEHALKEYGLFERAGLIEASVLLINAPECVVSEGIATTAAEIIFGAEELERWQRAELYPRAGVSDDLPVDVVLRLREAQKALQAVSGNAAWLLHVDAQPAADVIEYIMHFSSRTRAEAERSIRFVTEPLSRSYTYTYDVGRELVHDVLARGNRIAAFRRLLTEFLTPDDLRDWQ